MMRCWPAIRVAVFGLLLVSSSGAALAADPLVLLLLRMMRDQMISSAVEAGVTGSQQAARPEAAAVPRIPESQAEGFWLKGLIDESFVHLSAQQRDELHASLLRMLADPKNAPMRAEIVSEFTRQAISMRDAHRQLSRLSESDMKVIAAEARLEFQRLPQDQRQQLLQALQHGVPGMPRELHELMLAEFASVPLTR